MLADPSPNINMSISLMLASTLCTQVYRTIVTEWVPPADRLREPKGKRGWEKPSLINPQIKQSGGWVAKRLSSLLHSKDYKVKILLQLS
jgi:armadillo repeat-containing protein 8